MHERKRQFYKPHVKLLSGSSMVAVAHLLYVPTRLLKQRPSVWPHTWMFLFFLVVEIQAVLGVSWRAV